MTKPSTTTSTTLRKPWQAPTLRRIRAGEAENGFAPVSSDGPQFTVS